MNRAEGFCAGHEGFSILELMVSLGAAMVVLISVVSFTVTHHRAIANSARYIQGVRELRTSMKIVTTDVQRTGLNLSSTEKLAQADVQATRLNMDVNNDATPETISYSLDTTDPGNKKLMRNGGALVESVDALNFYYYDAAGTTLSPLPLGAADRALVRAIKIEVTARPTAVSGREKNVTFSTRVLLRN